MASTSVDEAKCIGCGACVSTAGDLYEMANGKAKAKAEDLSPEQVEMAKSAAGVCPVEAIAITE